MIDSHSHLFEDEFEDDFGEVLNHLKENNVTKVVLVGFSHEGNEKAYQLSQKYPKLFYNTAGLHPDQTDFVSEKDLKILEDFIKSHKVYALGEIGLDYHWTKDNTLKQKWLFEEQIKMAIKYQLPIVIHSRDADNDTFEILKRYHKDIKFVMHCYSGSKELALEYLKLGAYISLGGPVTFKNAVKPKEVAKIVPADKLFIETDSPYMAPTPMRGKRNESAYVIYVLKEIANIKEMDEKELENIIDQNIINFFKLD